MVEPELLHTPPDETAPSAEGNDAHGEATKRVEMSGEEAMALLREGKVVTNARVGGLKFVGAVPFAVSFRGCVLVKPEFRGATFAESVSIVACTIDRAQFNRKTTFAKNVTLDGSVLQKTALRDVTVLGELFAAHAEFKGKASFQGCEFAGAVHFWEAQFHTWASFQNCTFRGEADFRSVHAADGFVVEKCQFLGDFLFRGANVEKKFSADGSRFEKLLDLSKAKLRDFAYLESIVAGPGQTFAFLNAVTERVRVHPAQVEGRLLSEREGRHDDAMQEYGLLKKCYGQLHRFDAEDWAFYRFKVAQRRATGTSWRRPWTKWRWLAEWLFLDVGCGYGTNPLRAVRMAAVIVFGFALIYGTNVEKFYTDKLPFPGEGASKTDYDNAAMIGLTTSVSVFTSGMGGIRELAQGWMNVPVMVESVMGTLLFGLFIVAFSRKVIR